MRPVRPISVLAGFLVALLATGSLRLAHLVIDHQGATAPCSGACTGCPGDSRPASPDRPDTPAHPTPSDCATCLLLAVLTSDGLPIGDAPFFPAFGAIGASLSAPEPIAGDHAGIPLARGPPRITRHA